MSRYKKIERCRICGSADLAVVLDLGEQFLTGVFPHSRDTSITAGPMQLVKCNDSSGCGLLQLGHSYDLAEMYGDNYGYRSGLNASMVTHLHGKVRRILERVPVAQGDLVLISAATTAPRCKRIRPMGPHWLEWIQAPENSGRTIHRTLCSLRTFFLPGSSRSVSRGAKHAS